MIEVACLTIYGAAIALFGPSALRRLTGRGCAPRLGVAAWLAAAVSLLAAWGIAGVHASVHGSTAVRTIAVVLLVGMVGRVTWCSVRLARWTIRHRAEHRQSVMLVGRHDSALGAVVVSAPQRLVYCMPSGSGVVVVTTGARAALSADELRAALEHERAHLAGRHHAVMTVAHALSRVAPGLPLLGMLGRQVTMLLEMCADDHAGRLHGRRTVARAIAAMAVQPVPAGALGAGGISAELRVRRLSSPLSRWRKRVWALTTAATLAFLLAGPYLATIDPWCSRYHL